MKRSFLFLMIALASVLRSMAVSVTDPGLVTLILRYENQTKKALAAQELAMSAITTGHIWTKAEVEGVYNLQKEYNAYLDQFNGLLVYAAQGYGFYHEVGKLTENFGKLTKQLKESPMNAVAVALTPKRNKIYRELIMTSVDIVNDIRQVCLSDIKMTEKQRMEIVFGIRPKLKKINRKLMHLALAVKYTSLNDVWLEIDNRARDPLNKNRIADAAFRRWRNHGKVIIINPNRPSINPWVKPDKPIIPSLPKDSILDLPIDPITPITPSKPVNPIDPNQPIQPDDTPFEPLGPNLPGIGSGLPPPSNLPTLKPLSSSDSVSKTKSKTTSNFNTIR